MSNRDNNIKKNIISTSLSSYLAQGISILSYIVNANLIGPRYMGLYQTFIAYINYLLKVNIGESEAIRVLVPDKYYSNNPIYKDYINQSITLYLLTIILFNIIISTLSLLLVNDKVTFITIVAFQVIYCFEYGQSVFSNIQRAKNNFTLIAKIRLITAFVTLITLLLTYYFNYIGFLFHKIIIITIGFLLFFLKNSRIKLLFNTRLIKEIVKVGFLMTLNISLFQLFINIDKILISIYLGNEQVGYYSIAFQFSLPLLIFIQSYTQVFFTEYSVQFSRNNSCNYIIKNEIKMMRENNRYFFIIIGLCFFLIPIIVPFFLPKYTPGILPAQIIVIGFWSYAIAANFSNLYFIFKKGKSLLIINIIFIVLLSLFICFALNIFHNIISVAVVVSCLLFFYSITIVIIIQYLTDFNTSSVFKNTRILFEDYRKITVWFLSYFVIIYFYKKQILLISLLYMFIFLLLNFKNISNLIKVILHAKEK